MKTPRIVFLTALFFTTAFPVVAQETARDAKTLYKEGIAFFENGQFAEAASSFREAYNLKPGWKVLYNLGQAEASAKRHGLALEAFESYLSQGGDEIDPLRREEVVEEIKRLREIVGMIEIEAPDGAAVFVDGVERGKAPLSGSVAVEAGIVHKIEVVTATGTRLPERTWRVMGGQTARLSFSEKMEKTEEPQQATAVESSKETANGQAGEPAAGQEPRKTGRLKPLGFTALGLGGALLVAGAVTGGTALSANKDIKDNCPGGECPPKYADTLQKRDRLALSSDVLFGIGAAAAVTGAVMVVVAAIKGSGESSISVAPSANADTSGIVLQGRF